MIKSESMVCPRCDKGLKAAIRAEQHTMFSLYFLLEQPLPHVSTYEDTEDDTDESTEGYTTTIPTKAPKKIHIANTAQAVKVNSATALKRPGEGGGGGWACHPYRKDMTPRLPPCETRSPVPMAFATPYSTPVIAVCSDTLTLDR